MNNRGATLIEVMIGGTLVAIAAVATALMFATGQSFIQSEGDARVALQIAQERIERIRAGGFGCYECMGFPAGSPACDGREEPAGTCPVPSTAWATDATNHPGYRWRITITARCPNNFAIPSPTNVTFCSPGFPGTVEAKMISVTVQPLEGTSTTDPDRMAREVVLQGILVRR